MLKQVRPILDGKYLDDKATMLRATCALPIFFPVIKINNNEYMCVCMEVFAMLFQ